MLPSDEHDEAKVVAALKDQSYVVIPNWLNAERVNGLKHEFAELQRAGQFKAAGISKAAQPASEIRRDEICWFEPERLLPNQQYLWHRFDSLKLALNRELFLGLWDLEGHFASYEKGGFYKRHLDRFSNDDARTVTVVLYLNENWQVENGGELVIFANEKELTVAPSAGTLVVFMSGEIEHEVRESRDSRASFAGWFRRRT